MSEALESHDRIEAQLNQALGTRNVIEAQLDQALGASDAIEAQLNQARGERDRIQAQLDGIVASRGWRLLSRYGVIKHRFILPMFQKLWMRKP